MFAIRAQAETVADFDTVPQLHGTARRINAEQAARNRLVVAERIEVDASGVNAAMIVSRKIVHADRLGFPCSKQIPAFAGFLIPMNQPAAREHESNASDE